MVRIEPLLAGFTAALAVGSLARSLLGAAAIRRPDGARRGPIVGLFRHVSAAVDVRRAQGRARREVARDLPDLIEALARSVRAGSSISAAIVAAVPRARGATRDDLTHMAGRLDRGVPLAAVLDDWRIRRREVRGVGLTAAALQIAAEAGGSVARALDGVADTVRGQQHLDAEVRAMASQAEASAILIAVLPVVFAFVAAAADPAMLTFMVTTPIGLVCLVTGIALDVVALVWMRRITAGIEA